MRLKLTIIIVAFILVFNLSGRLQAETTIGGDVKFFLFDMSTGSSDITDHYGNTTTYDTTDRITMGFEAAHIVLFSELSDRVSFDVDVELSAVSGATPRLGYRLGAQRADATLDATSGATPQVEVSADKVSIGLDKAYIQVSAPGDILLSAGLLRPIFTEDYGTGKFFQEEYFGSVLTSNRWLGAWHDVGIELYRSFDLKLGKKYASVPVYFYLLNGGSMEYTDNNDNKTVMLHIAPEYAFFRLLGSFAIGRWDDDSKYGLMRYSAGLGFEVGDFWFRSEYMGGRWDNYSFRHAETRELIMQDIEPYGFYAKACYNIIHGKLRVILNYNETHHNFGGYFAVLTDDDETYRTITPTINYFVTDGSALIFQADFADWKNESETSALKYTRIAIGWRTIF